MYDRDVFMVVTAAEGSDLASSAFNLSHNSKWRHGATGNGLVLTFDELLKSDLLPGVHFGTNPKSCQVLLGHPDTPNMSERQFSIAVDDQLHIWLHDCTSKGTMIGRNGQYSTFYRIPLAYEPAYRCRFGDITVKTGGVVIRVEFPNHKDADPGYIQNLASLVEKSKRTGLGWAPSTVPPNEDRDIYFTGENIGSGVFGDVCKAIRVRDGAVVAVKKFGVGRKPASRPELLRKSSMEFQIAKGNPHPNVIKVFSLRQVPKPHFFMEYYPLGTLLDTPIVGEHDWTTALGQVLSGLKHLHSRGIVHRDIKPANILVSRHPLLKFVICDFGMAKLVQGSAELASFYGSRFYSAPELFPRVRDSYGTKVDVWSLGVIVLEGMYGPPTLPDDFNGDTDDEMDRAEEWETFAVVWSRAIRKKLWSEEEGKLVDVLGEILVFGPESRWSAEQCLKQGFETLLFKTRDADNLVVAA